MPKRGKRFLSYSLIVLGSVLAGAVAAEIYLDYHVPPRLNLPFYNVLYPYDMFRPLENATYETQETYAMSHFKSKVSVYTNADGFRIPAPHYVIPKDKPAGQFRVAFLGGSLVELASTFDTTLPGSLRTLLRTQYPGRDIEVINAGIQSCVSRQSLAEFLFTVVDYHPDLVILYDGGNDLGMPLVYDSRPNYPYNFQTMQEAWDQYRADKEQPVWKLVLQHSNLYRLIYSRLHPNERHFTPTADAPLNGTNALPAARIANDPAYVRDHVSEYLSNWRKLIELSAAYHYRPILVLSPTGGFNSEQGTKVLMQSFHLDRPMALQWQAALQALYGEATHEIGDMRVEYPQANFLDLSHFLEPAEKYFSDSDHVYDEVNAMLAQKIYNESKPAFEAALREVK